MDYHDHVRWIMDNFSSDGENTESIDESRSDHVNPKNSYPEMSEIPDHHQKKGHYLKNPDLIM